ncbi:hypothetical protein LTR28_007661, partial [Elasticomyces elasticus]
EGAVLLCLVTGLSSNGKVVKLIADTQRMGNVKKSHFLSEAPNVDVFLPGTAVQVLVTDATRGGLTGKVMGMLDVTADLFHSGAGGLNIDVAEKYKIGDRVKARVISTFPNSETKKVGISLLDHIVTLSTRDCTPGTKRPLPTAMSSIVESAKVIQVVPTMGLFLDLGVEGSRGFAHISKISENKIESLSESTGAYRVGSVHRGRIIAYNPMDGLYQMSLQKSVIEEPFLRIEDIEVGEVVKGTVERLILNTQGIGGVLVKLTDGITALVPAMHLSDIQLTHPERKFREGFPVKARVLSTDTDRRQVRLTLKKTLVNSDAPVWHDFKSISVGDEAPGTIINMLPHGAVVQFYGNVRAYLPVAEMSEAYIKDPMNHFRLGQTVHVRVLSVEPGEASMKVSCKSPSLFDASQEVAFKNLKPGTFVSGIVSEKSEEAVLLNLENSDLTATIRVEHLVDGPRSKALSTVKNIRVGQTLQELVVIEKLERRHLVVLSNKPSLKKAAHNGSLISRLEDLKEGRQVAGYIRNITPEGLYVQFAGNMVGMLPKSQATPEMAQLAAFGYRKDQSIAPWILSIDHARKRFVLTMKKPDATVTEKEVGPSTANLKLGEHVKARISSIKETQLNVRLANGVQGRIDVSEVFDRWEDIEDSKHPLRKFRKGQEMNVKILGIHDARNHRCLPITHRQGKVPVFELSAKTNSEDPCVTLDKLTVGEESIAFVNNVSADGFIWANLSPNVRGSISFSDLTSDFSLLQDLEKNFPVGSALRTTVKAIDISNQRLDLTALSQGVNGDTVVGPLRLENVIHGSILPGRVTKVTERSVVVQLSDTVVGLVGLTELADDFTQANPTIYRKNDIVRVCVLDVDIPNKRISLSMRPSRVLDSSLPVTDRQILKIENVRVNDIVRGFVQHVADNGAFVVLGPTVKAYVRISDISDSFIKDWKSAIEVDRLVTGRIVMVDRTLNHVGISLKASHTSPDFVPPLTFESLKPGQIVTGKIRKVEDFGAFIDVDGSNPRISGLCHRSQVADQRVQDVRTL